MTNRIGGSGDDSISRSLFRFCGGAPVYQCYGMTESAGIVFSQEPAHLATGGSGVALDDVEFRIESDGEIKVVDRKKAIILGEGRHFLGALIQIDQETVGKWAQTRGVAYTTFKNLSEHAAARQLIQGVVDEVNSRFARAENIRRFVLLEKEFDHDDGELTATRKVRRGMIEAKFARELALIYGRAA